MWMIFIPVLFIAGFLVYTYVIVPRLQENADQKNQALMESFALRIKGREDEERSKYLKNNTAVSPFTKEIKDEEVTGIISCMEKRELKDFVRQQAIEMGGRVLKSLTGVRVKEVDNTEFYFLVLTTQNIHYLHYSDKGKLKEHLSFDRSKLQDLETGTVSSGDMLKNNAAEGDSTRLSFVYEGTQYKFFYYNDLWAHPLAKIEDEDRTFAEINYLFAVPFKKYADSLRK